MTSGISSAEMSCTVRKFNLDGSRITYKIVEYEEDGSSNGILEVDEPESMEAGDYYKISFDNTGVPNFGAITEAAYDGGKILLILAGTTTFTATKEWLEPADEEITRPEATFELWRYRAGQNYTSAAAVRKDGQIVSCKADPAEDVQEILFKNAEPLEKYDPDGYRYIYVVREYLEGAGAGSYTPVFGKLQTETSGAEENLRQSGDHFVYNTGVISNRYNETVTVEARKEWKAAVFQADFEDAAVELTLQSRPKGSEDDAWTDTDETLVMGNFRSEHLINTGAATVPKYDAEGHELEYRWE